MAAEISFPNCQKALNVNSLFCSRGGANRLPCIPSPEVVPNCHAQIATEVAEKKLFAFINQKESKAQDIIKAALCWG